MILIDTSAWVEFLRNTGSPVCDLVDELLAGDVAVCDAIRMEVLAGARDETHLGSLRRLLARATVIRTETARTTMMLPLCIAVAEVRERRFGS